MRFRVLREGCVYVSHESGLDSASKTRRGPVTEPNQRPRSARLAHRVSQVCAMIGVLCLGASGYFWAERTLYQWRHSRAFPTPSAREPGPPGTVRAPRERIDGPIGRIEIPRLGFNCRNTRRRRRPHSTTGCRPRSRHGFSRRSRKRGTGGSSGHFLPYLKQR